MKIVTKIILILVATVYNLHAQDYIISFAGTGSSTTVDQVRVENLTQATSITVNGSDVLHLQAIVTGIDNPLFNESAKISLYPNPLKDYSRMQFFLPESGRTNITLYDLSGRAVTQTSDLLARGQHTYRIQGIEDGIFFIRISSGRYSFSGRLVSSGSVSHAAKIMYEHTSPAAKTKKTGDTKGTTEEVAMQYNTGDRLKLTGISGDFSTVITDIPVSSKTITFSFVECTDGDGNSYPVVHIVTAKGGSGIPDPENAKGDQIWMAANLKTTKYNDGTDIPLVTDNTEWTSRIDPAYCWYNNDETANKDVYGALYNWYTVNTGKLCPDGWHVPTITEWKALTGPTGYSNTFADKLREVGSAHWLTPNDGATNETGFTALPGGYRNEYTGLFGTMGYDTYWWSTTVASDISSWDIEFTTNAYVQSYNYQNEYGLSVRCIKD